MEEYQKEDDSITFCYSQPDRSQYAMGRRDGLDDTRSSMIDRTMNEPESDPLAGPSTYRAAAIESRALNMMVVPAGLTTNNTRQRPRGIGQHVRKGLSNLVFSIVGSSTNRRRKRTKDAGLVETYSDSSLVFVTAQDATESSPTSPQLHGSLCQHRGPFSTQGWQPECPPDESASDGTLQITQLPQPYIGTGLLSSDQGAMRSELFPPGISQQQTALQVAPMKHHTQSPNYEQRSDIAPQANFVQDGDMSVLELPGPMYEQTEYYSTARHGRIVRDSLSTEETLSGPEGGLGSTAHSPRSPSQSSSGSLVINWQHFGDEEDSNKQDFEDESFLGALTPPRSLLIEETDSLMGEPDIVDEDRRSSCSSLENSAISSKTFGSGECHIPTIYPGMESYPPSASCGSDHSEVWCNNSRSLLDSVPAYHDRGGTGIYASSRKRRRGQEKAEVI